VVETFLALEGEVDFLLSHSNEVPSHRAALELKRLRPDLPWVAYFGDVVSANPYVRHMAEYPLFADDCATEQATLQSADLVICNNDYQRALFVKACPTAARRLVTVPHCFEATWYPPAPQERRGPLTFVHLGTLYPVKRSAQPLLAATELLLDVYPEHRDQFRLVFVGDDVPERDRLAWQSMRHGDHVLFKEGVPYLDSLGLMASSDVLVIIDGVFDESELDASPYLPGKLTDYLGAGKPLLASTMRRGPTADLLEARREPWADDDPERLAFVMRQHLTGRVSTRRSSDRLYRAEVVGAAMEICFRAALLGAEGVDALPGLLHRLFDAARSAA
jgi:hypothetical protein